MKITARMVVQAVILLKRPVIISILTALVSLVVSPFVEWHYHTAKVDTAAIVGVAGIFGIFWAVLGTYALNMAVKRWWVLSNAIRTQDRKRFLDYYYGHVPSPLKLLIVLNSLALETGLFMLHFHCALCGVVSCFWVTLIMAACYEAIDDIDTPLKGIYNVQNVPKAEEWLATDGPTPGKEIIKG